MTTQIKSVYMMIASPHQGLKQRLHALSMHGFEFLNKTNRAFPIHLGRMKRMERPKDIRFPEYFQLIPTLDKSKEDLVGHFKKWIQGEGASTPDSIWDTYFFTTKLADPESSSSEYYYLVYFDYSVDDKDIMSYTSFLSATLMATKQRDIATQTKLLKSRVRCVECMKLIDPVLIAVKDTGFLQCPFCGQWWTKSAKNLSTSIHSEQKWWQFWK